ncbi:MAG: sporulation integral membrane protein YtvI [Clostridia bacterium]|nr:sporulation integral membrane protein YtvI [Clostridia bacterium]
MNINYEKYYRTAVNLILIIVVFLLIYIVTKYLLPFFAPFVIAILIALINEPVIRILIKRARLPRNIAAILSLLFTISILGFLITLGIIKIYNELVVLQENLSGYIDNTSSELNHLMDRVANYYENLPESVSKAVNENLTSLAPKLEGVIKSLVTYLINTITSIPKVAVFIIVTLLASYFISSDRNKISNFFSRQFPDNWSRNFSGIKSDTFTAVFAYFKALLILMSITFIEVSLGLFIIKADYVLLMGLIVALSDAIPVLGTGIVMVPWITWNLITGNTQMALGLTVIYLAGVIVRQVLEPKIVGDQIGLHPLITLIAMYIGLNVFGVLGLFIGPVSVIIVKNLQTSGLLRLWKD